MMTATNTTPATAGTRPLVGLPSLHARELKQVQRQPLTIDPQKRLEIIDDSGLAVFELVEWELAVPFFVRIPEQVRYEASFCETVERSILSDDQREPHRRT